MEMPDEFEQYRARAMSGGGEDSSFCWQAARRKAAVNCSSKVSSSMISSTSDDITTSDVESLTDSYCSSFSKLTMEDASSLNLDNHKHYYANRLLLDRHRHTSRSTGSQRTASPSRSHSLRDRPSSRRSDSPRMYPNQDIYEEDWHMGTMRPRVTSMPAGASREDYFRRYKAPSLAHTGRRYSEMHRVKRYSITRKGVVNQGERYVYNSTSSMCSNESVDSNPSMTMDRPRYKVIIFGDITVGKRSLIQRFLLTDQLGSMFSSIDDETEKSVSVLLDGEESTLEFLDVSHQEMDEFLTSDQVDAYVIVYSVEDRRSFEGAIDRLYELRKEEDRQVAVILVANKTDLVRSRIVLEEEGKSAAKTYDCKYIEVSAAIDHKVDELLVGILKQIRLINKKKIDGKARLRPKPEDTCCLLRTKQNVLGRLLTGNKFTSKSCENLYVL